MLQQTRREFLKATGLTAGVFLMPVLVSGRSKPSDKPNILVIMSDEHNASVLGCCGNDIVQTPSIAATATRRCVCPRVFRLPRANTSRV